MKKYSNKLLKLINRICNLYEEKTGDSFYKLCNVPEVQSTGRLITRALDILFDDVDYSDVSFSRGFEDMSPADMFLLDSCLKYSLKDEFLLIHYNETALWSDKHFAHILDVWDIYQGILYECRSAVIDLKSMEYVLLPYDKFRNINEALEYSIEKIAERIGNADKNTVEFSKKLDGSMIQIRYTGDNRFLNKCMISTSGSLNSEQSYQLKDVMDFLQSNGNPYYKLLRDFTDYTAIFEWIDGNDPHIVQYNRSEWGLYLIGLRNIFTGNLLSYKDVIHIAEEYAVSTTNLYFMSLEEVLRKLPEYKGSKMEGFVLNIDGFLVKIKCPDFIEVMRLAKDSSSFNVIIRHVVNNTIDDFLSQIPKDYHERVKNTVRQIWQYEDKMKKQIEEAFLLLPVSQSKKDVMIFINNSLPRKYEHLKGYLRAKYLGMPIEILAKKKGDSMQYIKEKDIRV